MFFMSMVYFMYNNDYYFYHEIVKDIEALSFTEVK